jgi:4-hydroxy-tetrahydrodipicolinate synthase
MPFGRLLTAMVTPMRDDLSVDYAAVEPLVDHLVATGSESLVVTGTTGESPTLTAQEKLELYRVARSAAAGRASIIAGTGNYNTAESVALTREAEKAGAEALLLVVPYYNNPPQEGLYRHFKAIAESSPLPVLLYNVPSRTARNMEAGTTLRLAEVPNIVGIKEASGNLEQIGAILAGCPSGFLVYSGDDAATLPMMAMGAHGVVSVASHLAGRLIRQMIDDFCAGRTAAAAELHRRLTPLFKACFVTTNPIPVKAGLHLLGLKVGGVRLPLIPATSDVEDQVRSAMSGLGLL